MIRKYKEITTAESLLDRFKWFVYIVLVGILLYCGIGWYQAKQKYEKITQNTTTMTQKIRKLHRANVRDTIWFIDKAGADSIMIYKAIIGNDECRLK